MDRLRHEGLRQARGSYSAISTEQIGAQIQPLRQLCMVTKQINVVVTGLRKHGLSSGFATRSGPHLHYCFEGYLELRSPEPIALFLDLAPPACAVGDQLATWLDSSSKVGESNGPYRWSA